MKVVALAILGTVATIAATPVRAQTIEHTEVRQYVGEEVTVRGPVARVERISGGGLRFSLGRTYSRRTLQVYAPLEVANSLDPDLRSYEGKTVEVRGRILTGEAEGLERGTVGSSTVPAMILADASRIKVVSQEGEKNP